MAARFTQLETARVADFASAERVRRSHQLAIEELRAEVRRLEALPRCIGVAHFSKAANESLTVGAAIAPGTLDLNTAGSIISTDGDDTISLAKGYKYRLTACLYCYGAADYASYRWRNVSDGEYFGVAGYAPSLDLANAFAGQHLASATLNAAATKSIQLWCSAVAGTPTAGTTYSWITVEAYQ